MNQHPAGISAHLRRTFLAGALAAVPLAVTAFVIWYVEGKTRVLTRAMGLDIPFLGVVVALGGIYLLGLALNSLMGRLAVRLVDGLLARIPVFKSLYQAWKQIALTSDGGEGMFGRVVLVADETGRMSMLGFSNGLPVAGADGMCCVFVPAAPNPTSGRLYFVRLADCRFLDMAPEDAFKMILSGGNYVPAVRDAGTMVGAERQS